MANRLAMRWFVSRRRVASVRAKAHRNLADRSGRVFISSATSPWGIANTSQSVCAMAWAEAGAWSKNSTSPKKSHSPRMVSASSPTPGTTLLMRTLPDWMTWSWPPAEPSVMMTAPWGCRRMRPTMSTWASSSSSSSAKRGTLRRNCWIIGAGERSYAAQEVAELLLLRLQVAPGAVGGRHLEGHAVGDLQAVAGQAHELARVVGEQQDPVQAQLVQDLGPDAVVALVGLEAQALVGLDRVLALVLELVGHDLVHEADAAALLAQVEQHALFGPPDHLQRAVKLAAAVAA